MILIVFLKHNESASNNPLIRSKLQPCEDLNPEQLFRWASSLEWSKELPDIDGWL